MKKSIFGFASLIFGAMMFISCGTTKVLGVTGTEAYETSQIKYNALLKNVEWKDYKLSLGLISESTVKFDLLIVHSKETTMTQSGKLYKSGTNVNKVDFTKGLSLDTSDDVYFKSNGKLERFTTIDKKEEISIIKINDKEFILAKDKNNVVIEDDSVPVTVKTVLKYTENGKLKTCAEKNPAGAEIYVGNDRYAVIDYISKPLTVKINKDIEKKLTADKKLLLDTLILSVYNYDVNFKNSEIHIKKETSAKGFEFSLF